MEAGTLPANDNFAHDYLLQSAAVSQDGKGGNGRIGPIGPELISDFLGQGFEKQMRVLGKRHDLIAVSITDPREVKMPSLGLIQLEDAETGELVMIDTGSASFRKQYERLGSAQQGRLRGLFRSMDVDHIEIFTDRDYVFDLVKFFKTRERRAQK